MPFASPLSANWERNDGLITYKDSGYAGDTSHAGGHAYLIVGYRKLSGMQDEGGMCFVIKNSWGTGWGVNGYSCMTLKWVEKWNFGYDLSHPVTQDVLLRDDLRNATELPNNDEAEDSSPIDVPNESDEDAQADDNSDGGGDDPLDKLPRPKPQPDVEWTRVKLLGPGESYYRAEIADKDGGKIVRAIVRADAGFTNPISLEKGSAKANVLVYDGDRVGELAGDTLYLCSGAYDLICSLRLNTNKNSLYVEFPYPDNRSVKDSDLPEGGWESIDIPYGDYGFDVYNPDDKTWLLTNSKTFFRMKKGDGGKTKPSRLSVDNESMDIKAMGESVGSINPSSPGLCTGSYSGKCSVFSAKGDDELNILPSW